MAEQNVFWYYAGNKPQRVVINDMPSLVSPHFYVLAPPTQQWPRHCAQLFKRKQPPADILKRFGESGRLATERQKQIQQESREANEARAQTAKDQAAAVRRGEGAEALSLSDAVTEKGSADPAKPPSEPSTSSPKKRETRAEKKARLKAEKEAAKAAAEAEKGEQDKDEDNT